MKGSCTLCGKWRELETHHIFEGPNRKLSEKYGLKIKLCSECHRDGPRAAHKSADTARILHELGQRKFMAEQHATVDEFRRIFGKNYLDEAQP